MSTILAYLNFMACNFRRFKIAGYQGKGYNGERQMYAHVDGACNLYVRSCM
jgi:hypothetical protein